MNKITNKYTKEELLKKGIWVNYILNPCTFNPVITMFSLFGKETTKEFHKETTFEEMNEFIDEWVDEILIRKRTEKINKIIDKWKY